MKVAVFHNVRWSRYKARVFSELFELAQSGAGHFTFCQIADRDAGRAGLSSTDLSYHNYPHTLLFSGEYDAIPTAKLVAVLLRELWARDADLVILPGYNRVEYWVMLLVARALGRKVAVFCDSTIHDRPQRRLRGFMKRLFFSLCDGFFAYGQRSAEYLRHYGASPSKIYQRCQAAALPAAYNVATVVEARLRFEVPHPRFLYVGRLSPEKSLDVLLSAFASARVPDSVLALAGTGPDERKLKALARNLSISERVFFLGGLEPEQLATEYARATCLVLPSTSEPWGLVVNEALHYGCPVIVSSACGCVPELVREEITGLVFPARDDEELAVKLELAVRLFADKVAVARACTSHIESYSPTRAANQILAGCKSILSGG